MTLLLNKLGRLSQSLLCPRQKAQLILSANKFWEPDHRGGYDTAKTKPVLEHIKEGLPMLVPEVKKFKDEWQTILSTDNTIPFYHGDYDVLWRFDNEETINSWVVTTDSDHSEGKSRAEFILGRNKTGIFRGKIDIEPPKDGKTKWAGYANIKSPRNFKSFKRQVPYDWSDFTHLVIRCRGDGRPLSMIMAMDRYFDVQWHDQYHYVLFTRGGPYWQTAKIPFSKFYLAAKGRIQDKQTTLRNQLDQVQFLGFTLGDGVNGPFQLEIDYIALMFDENHREQFAYEMYQVDPAVHSG